MLGHCLVHAGRFDASEPVMRRARDAIRPLHDSYADLFADQSLGVMLVLCGRWHEAREFLERGLAVAGRVGARRYETSLLLQLSECEWRAGSRSAARTFIEKARTLMDDTTFGFVGPALYAHAAVASDDAAERDRLLEEGEARLAGTLAHNLTWFYRAAIEVRLAERDPEAVESLCDRLLAFRPEGEPPGFHCVIAAHARALALLEEDPDAGAARLEAVRADMAARGMQMTLPIELPRN
jgi:tetratricopeptide (TPR) repeat protein